MKKYLLIAGMSGLTLSAAMACKWQLRRYDESKQKWDKIFEQFNQKDFKEYFVNNLPFDINNF